MEFHQMRYFLSVCKHRSFTMAAQECGVSQPALTAAIKKLEAELGDPLFHREGRRVFLSALGELMRPRIENIMSEMAGVSQAIAGYQRLERAPLRVGVMNSIGPLRIGRHLSKFQASNPGVDLEIHEGNFDNLALKLQNDELDMAILSSPHGINENFRHQLIYRERYLVIFPPDHRFTALEQIPLKEVAEEKYIDRLICELREMVMEVCAQREVSLYASFRSQREDWVQSMVANGMGIAFMPEYSVTHSGVHARPLVDPEVSREIHLLRMPGRKLSPAASAFIKSFPRQAH